MTEEKIPTPPSTFLPVKFWVEVMSHLDKKVELITSPLYGFGDITLTIKIQNHTVKDVIFGDNLRLRDLISQTGIAFEPKEDKIDKV